MHDDLAKLLDDTEEPAPQANVMPEMRQRREYAMAISERLAEIIPQHPPATPPKRYTPDIGELMVIMARAEGAPFVACLAEVGLSKSRADKWLLRYPHFAECKERAEGEAIRFWHKIGVLGVAGQIPRFNSDVWKMYMKNLARFVDKVDVNAEIKSMTITCEIGNDGTIIKKESDNTNDYLNLLKSAMDQEDECSKAIEENEK